MSRWEANMSAGPWFQKPPPSRRYPYASRGRIDEPEMSDEERASRKAAAEERRRVEAEREAALREQESRDRYIAIAKHHADLERKRLESMTPHQRLLEEFRDRQERREEKKRRRGW